MNELKPCPFCGGKAKLSFKDYRFLGYNGLGDKKVSYRVQVICNKCHSRGKPIITGGLVNPNPYISLWYGKFRRTKPAEHQTELFRPFAELAIEAWNRRVTDDKS